MARKSLPKSLISRAEDAAGNDPEPENTTPPAGAWRAGATAQLRADLDAAEADTAARILTGQAELALDPGQIDDPLGSDRRPDWREQEEFLTLKASIAANGQDVPVQVTPLDATWKPDPRDPFATGETRFALLAGRRRLAALQELQKPVRAVIVPVEGQGAARHSAMLARRWRENAERADLSAFERLLAIGEMFEAAKKADKKETAAAFGDRIGVSESVISRARAVSARQADILATVPDPYALSNTALYKLLPRLDAPAATAKAPPARAPLDIKREAGPIRLSARVKDGTLSVTAKGLSEEFDPRVLNALVDDIVRKLKKESRGGH